MPKLAMFDLDGTLADTVNMCLDCFEEILHRYLGDAAPSRSVLLSHFGRNEPGILRSYLGEAKTAEAFRDFCLLHQRYHDTRCPAPFPGMRELLEDLQRHGVRLVLITGRSEENCRTSMQKLHLGQYFEAFRYGNPEHNEKCAQMLDVLHECGIDASESVYIGDSVSDATAAHQAHVPCCSAAWASSVRVSDLEAVNPGKVLLTVAALRQHLLG